MKTMISKFTGRCNNCNARVNRGEKIQYHGRGLGISCFACSSGSKNEDEAAGFEPGTLASDRRLARQGLTVVRFSSGESFTQNSRGRCEDAPCCGCCS